MKNFLKLGLAVCGIALASLASSNTAEAKDTNSSNGSTVVAPVTGGCYGAGSCGTTSQGTKLNGSWRE